MVSPAIDMLSVFITPWMNPTRSQCAIRPLRDGVLRVMARQNMVDEQTHALCIAACGEILKGADPNVARRDAGEDSTGKNPVADHRLTGQHGGQRAGGRY